MLSTQRPNKFSIPFANNAGSANVRPIPAASQITIQPGAASLTDGFPPLNFTPVAAGGIPPFGQDMNGILNQTTSNIRWELAGGQPTFDAVFAAAIGGYPLGAVLSSNSGHCTFESTAENNLVDPNILPLTNWNIASTVWGAHMWQASGSANLQVVVMFPGPSDPRQLVGIPICITSVGTNTGGVTLNINGISAQIATPGGAGLSAGALLSGFPFIVVYSGSAYILMSSTGNAPVVTFNARHGPDVTLNSADVTGALGFTPVQQGGGAGQLTNKVLLGWDGVRPRVQIDNSDRGEIAMISDFPFTFGGVSGYFRQKFPTGQTILANGGNSVTGNNDFIPFPDAFANGCSQVVANEGNPFGWAGGASPTLFGTIPTGQTGFQLFVLSWNNSAKTWSPAAGIAYRYIAVGN